jgi:two-component system sensor histidine kinase TctE
VDNESGQVLVTENTLGRNREARQILLSTLAENALLVSMTLLLVWLGVRLGMRPLDALSHAVTSRAADDLRPVPDGGWPQELRPLVLALNRLLSNLHQASVAEQAFLSNAAHQLRTPLAGVLAQLELATTEIDGAALARVESARRALQQLTHSTHQMLALARSAPQASQGFDFGPVELPQLLEECASTWLDSAVALGVDLGFEAAPARLAHGSVWMLHELLGNLVHNAIRHSPRGGEVTVRCGRTEVDGCWLEVEDQGPGVPEVERDRIFERFYRVAGTPAGGAGLGLSIVREVADRHHAVITLHEGSDGRGLKVRLRFPAS